MIKVLTKKGIDHIKKGLLKHYIKTGYVLAVIQEVK